MHGIIHYELRRFVEHRYGGQETWDTLLTTAELEDSFYLPNGVYPDEHIVKILQAASTVTKKSIDTLQREFGEFIVPSLVKTYGAYIKREWNILDFLENIEGTIHTTVRRNNPGATPPELKIKRVNPNEVVIEYSSSRRMFGVLHGILAGVIKHYQATVIVKELSTTPIYTLSVQQISLQGVV